jgi:hypothetical protein
MKLYICGDSFCTNDPEYDYSWVDLLAQKLPKLEVVNLSSSGASNYLVYLQVKTALENHCDYLIYHATSSIRQEFRLGDDGRQYDDVTRYWNTNNPNKNAPMICGSWLEVDRHYQGLVDTKQVNLINQFFKHFVDLPNLIEKNYIFVVHTLEMIKSSAVAWAWSQGGFEHPRFGIDRKWNFDPYLDKMCPINLWDHYDPKKIRPWFHVTDPTVHQRVCDHYIKMLQLENYQV